MFYDLMRKANFGLGYWIGYARFIVATRNIIKDIVIGLRNYRIFPSFSVIMCGFSRILDIMATSNYDSYRNLLFFIHGDMRRLSFYSLITNGYFMIQNF